MFPRRLVIEEWEKQSTWPWILRVIGYKTSATFVLFSSCMGISDRVSRYIQAGKLQINMHFQKNSQWGTWLSQYFWWNTYFESFQIVGSSKKQIENAIKKPAVVEATTKFCTYLASTSVSLKCYKLVDFLWISGNNSRIKIWNMWTPNANTTILVKYLLLVQLIKTL